MKNIELVSVLITLLLALTLWIIFQIKQKKSLKDIVKSFFFGFRLLHRVADKTDNYLPQPLNGVLQAAFDVTAEAVDYVEYLFKIGDITDKTKRKSEAIAYIQRQLGQDNIELSLNDIAIVEKMIDTAAKALPKTFPLQPK